MAVKSPRNFESDIAYAKRYGKLGLALGMHYQTRHIGSDNNEFSYGDLPIFIHEDSDGELLESGEEIEALENFELRDYDIKSSQLSLSLHTDHRVSPNTDLWLGLWFNRFDDREYRQLTGFNFEDGSIFQSDPRLVTETEISRELKDRYEIQEIWISQLGANHSFIKLKVDWSLSLTGAREKEPKRQDVIYTSEADLNAAPVSPLSRKSPRGTIKYPIRMNTNWTPLNAPDTPLRTVTGLSP